MKVHFTLLATLFCTAFHAQYQFTGQVSETYRNQNVYLSLVEDYRKTSRVYLNQIIQTQTTDSLGYFSFEGSALPKKNRIYRIHVDGCAHGLSSKNHFLRECSSTESLLFIGNYRDTISIPLLAGQAFCSISSTNSASSSLLEMEALKEEMIVDFSDYNSEMANSLLFENWFKKLQDFGLESTEPLVELCIYDFLSDRKNETSPTYLKTLANSSYYHDLEERLSNNYPEASFTIQYAKELAADKKFIEPDSSNFFGLKFDFKILLLLAPILAVIFTLFWRRRKGKNSNKLSSLTAQELKITQAIKLGKTNKEIAAELFISLSTVKTHINSIYKKLDVDSRSELRSKF